MAHNSTLQRIMHRSARASRDLLPWMFVVIGMIFFSPAFAQSTPVITNVHGIQQQLCNVFTWMFWILLSVSVIMVFYAAFLYVTAQDDAEQVSRAKMTIFYAAIGVAVALLALNFPSIVASIFGQSIHACESSTSRILPG